MSGPGYYVVVAGTTHLGISDYGLLIQHFGGSPSGGGAGFIDPHRWHEINTTLVRELFEAHLLGKDPAHLMAEALAFPEVTMQSH